MTFQFQCPQGHLLSGDESQAGQACHCPTCGMLFLIPQPLAPAAGPFGGPQFGGATAGAAPFAGLAGPATPASQFAPPYTPPPSEPEPIFVPGQPSPGVAAEPEPAPVPDAPELLHIPCPNGHELETPVDMLDQEVLCPTCNTQFKLRRKNSREFIRKKELEEKIRLEKVGGLWLTWAIIAVIGVGLGLVGLIVASQMK
jgi:hypothetical protein